MAVTVERQTKTVQAGELIDARADYVSLVRHGANRTGFAIVKSDRNKPSTVTAVQALYVPTGTDVAGIAALPGCAWVNDVPRDKVEKRDSFDVYTAQPRDAFKEETIKMRALGNKGGIVVYGLMKELKQDAIVMDTAWEASLAETDPEDYAWPPTDLDFSDLFCREVQAFMGSVQGILSQSQGDPVAQRTAVMGSWAAFGKFLGTALDAALAESASPELAQKIEGAWRRVVEKAQWTKAYVNSLPDSAFVVVEKGYKEGDNKTARHLPYKDADGAVDMPHLRNAMARANQLKSVLGKETDEELRARAQKRCDELRQKYMAAEKQEGEDDMALSKEEIQDLVVGVVTAIKAAEVPAPVTNPAPVVAPDPALDARLTKLEGDVAGITASVTALTAATNTVVEKIEKFGQAPASTPNATKTDEPTPGAGEAQKALLAKIAKWESYGSKGVPPAERDGMFHGTLFNWSGIERSLQGNA